MLKLTKYEFRKNITATVVMLGIIGLLQVYFLGAVMADNRDHTALAAGLLVTAATVSFFVVLANSVSSYSKELSQKTSYLTFMTPISSHKIIGSKLISAFVTGTIFVLILVCLGIIDMGLFEKVYPETELLTEFIDVLLESIGYAPDEFFVGVAIFLVEFIISFYSIIAMAYFSITLSSTAFQNKKYKGVVSGLIFVAIILVISKVEGILPVIYEYPDTMLEAVVTMIPSIVLYTVVTIAGIIGSGILLEKKVSL